LVLQSSGFSLLNSDGEKLQLKNSEGNIVDDIVYNPDSGGKDGNTLCLIGDIWRECQNTVGVGNTEAEGQNNGSDNSSGSTGSADSKKEVFIPNTYVEFTDVVNGKARIKAEIEDFPTAVAGARASFKGRAFGLTDTEINGVEYI